MGGRLHHWVQPSCLSKMCGVHSIVGLKKAAATERNGA